MIAIILAYFLVVFLVIAAFVCWGFALLEIVKNFDPKSRGYYHRYDFDKAIGSTFLGFLSFACAVGVAIIINVS